MTQGLLAGCVGGDFDLAGIGRDGGAPLGRADEDAIATDFETGSLAGLGHGDDQLGQARLQFLCALLGGFLPIELTGGARLRSNVEKLRPGAGDAAALFVAVGQVKLRTDAGVETIALL